MSLPIDKLDLATAWIRVKNDSREGRTFVDEPYDIKLIEFDLDAWLKALKDEIVVGYRPQSPIVTDIPKGNGGVRPAALLTLKDRVVYAATIGCFLPDIEAGLRWSQGKIDFAYQLPRKPTREGWFTNVYRSWAAFSEVGMKTLDSAMSTSTAVFTDITGFYENIDLAFLFSDLRALGCAPDILPLLQTCLNRWCVVPGRGLPQGLSASDVLAKVFLNNLDHAMTDAGIKYMRYVDDVRMFCDDTPSAKKALMLLTQQTRLRGLSLQSEKTVIVASSSAKRKIDGVTPIIEKIHSRYIDTVAKFRIAINPYASISEIEDKIGVDEVPIDVVHDAFTENFLSEKKSFNKTLFHYLINRLRAQKDDFAVVYCLKQFAINPQETEAVLAYVAGVGKSSSALKPLEQFLVSSDCIYDYQIYQIFDWLNDQKIELDANLIAIARKIAFDHAKPHYLRATCRVTLQKYGNQADLERIHVTYAHAHNELDKAQTLVAVHRMETSRRNAFYARVEKDCLLCELAVKLVKNGKA